MTDTVATPSDPQPDTTGSQPAPSTAPAAPRAGRRRRAASLTGQVAAVIGIVVSLALIVGVLVGRGWLVTEVDDTSGTIDTAIARTLPLVDGASAAVADVEQQITEAVDAAEAVIADRAASAELLQGLLARVNAVSERYLGLRNNYAALREDVVSAIDRLRLLEGIIPGFAVPQGPIDALAALDERIQALDDAVMPLISAGTAGDGVAQAISERSRLAAQAAGAIQERLDGLHNRLEDLRADVSSFAQAVTTVINVGAIVMILLLLYIAFLHIILFRASRGHGRAPAATAP